MDAIEFEAIGRLNALGNSSITEDYYFEDNNINHSKAYYRLKMVDLDLTHEYSHTITISRKLDEILIYPNPTNGEITFDFGLEIFGEHTITFVNILGEKIEETVYIDGSSSIIKSELLNEKTNGIYFIQIRDKNGNLIQDKKIIKR